MVKNKKNQLVSAISGVHAGDVARYVLLPGIVPRLRDLVERGAGSLAMLMALVFAAVRLLPPNHPYLVPGNKGRFSMRHVFGEAWRNLQFRRENIDQILIFFALVAGFALLILQFVFVLLSFIISHAHAQATFDTMFTTKYPDKDVALMLLDSVFGVPNFFNSCVSFGDCGASAPTFTSFPTPFQQGLQQLFSYYSLAMLLIAVLVVCYYVIIVVGETAQTGTPFGRRFDHIWAPLRLIMAIGLLVPLSYGYNSGQYIVLAVARMASGFATNAWLQYNTDIRGLSGSDGGSPLGYASFTPTATSNDNKNYPPVTGDVNSPLVVRPPLPDVTPLVEFMTLVTSCRLAYDSIYSSADQTTNQNDSPIVIKAYMVAKGKDAVELKQGDDFAADYDQALTYYSDGPVVIVFGDLNTTKWDKMTSDVYPFCGQITIPTQAVYTNSDGTTNADVYGVYYMDQGYFKWLMTMYYKQDYAAFAWREGCMHLSPPPGGTNEQECEAEGAYISAMTGTDDTAGEDPSDAWKQERSIAENLAMQQVENTAYQDMVDGLSTAVPDDMLARGWGGAGIWYNEISRWNGAFISAVKDLPSVSKMPDVMETVASKRAAKDQTVTADQMYDLGQSNGDAMEFKPNEKAKQIAQELDEVYKYWNIPKSTVPVQGQSQGNVIIDTIHVLFGIDGLYDMMTNDYVNPLVTLVALGNSILNGALRNLLIANVMSLGGGFLSVINQQQIAGFGMMLQGGAAFFMSLATVAIGIGVTLYYILPFMPFLYFYFSVGQWVKSIFEAMVGVPLWALAHLKINGEGLPTESAIAGYFMIFEIFLRPILTVFGMLAAMSIFSALVRTLNNLFPLVTVNITGFDCAHCDNTTPEMLSDFKRNSVDQFFFTILYTIVVYMIGTSCFKMIDQVPDNVLRWMGQSVSSFAQMGREPVGERLGERATEAVTVMQNMVAGPSNQATAAAGEALAKLSGFGVPPI